MVCSKGFMPSARLLIGTYDYFDATPTGHFYKNTRARERDDIMPASYRYERIDIFYERRLPAHFLICLAAIRWPPSCRILCACANISYHIVSATTFIAGRITFISPPVDIKMAFQIFMQRLMITMITYWLFDCQLQPFKYILPPLFHILP